MRFATLFELRLRHDYYADGRCRDFDVTPTLRTATVLRNHRAQVRALPDGVRVLCATTAAGQAFIPIPAGTRLDFDLRLSNPDFALFTDMGALEKQRAALYSNTTAPVEGVVELTLSSLDVFESETLRVAAPGPNEPFVLRGKPVEGVETTEFRVTAGADAPTPPFVYYSALDKRLLLDTGGATIGQVLDVRYPVREPGSRRRFARVSIDVDESITSPDSATRLQVTFGARAARWAYYFVTDLTEDVAAVAIVDTSSAPEVRFGSANRLDLNTAPELDDVVAGDLARRYPRLRRIRFLSDERIACRESPRKGLELHVGGSVLPGMLPNPSIREFATLAPAAGAVPEDALFRVLPVIGNSRG